MWRHARSYAGCFFHKLVFLWLAAQPIENNSKVTSKSEAVDSLVGNLPLFGFISHLPLTLLICGLDREASSGSRGCHV
eukprot:5088688-Amphidinium_carterae.1